MSQLKFRLVLAFVIAPLVATLQSPLHTEKPPANEDFAKLKARRQGIGPNQGYEYMWKSVPADAYSYSRISYKCKLCPSDDLTYLPVCATDSTGEVRVNVSKCLVWRQNCLRGSASGTSWGVVYDYNGGVFVVQDGFAHLSIQQERDTVIVLSTTPPRDYRRPTPPYYEIRLDNLNSARTKLLSTITRDNPKNRVHVTYYSLNNLLTKALGQPDTYQEFVMHWDKLSGYFLMTKPSYTDWTQGFHLEYVDPDPFPIKFIAISGSWGWGLNWTIRGLMVTHATPCPYLGAPYGSDESDDGLPPFALDPSAIKREDY